MIKYIRLTFIALSIFLITVSFWLFSRFTVDDAFITWRYGKNLIDFGVWNYNPSLLDLTQAYTNPIYAILGIIPAYLGIDVVLFFKLFSLALLIIFFVYFYSKTKSLLMTLMAYAVPATFIHAFSGLETFLFVTLIVTLFISMDEDKPVLSTFLTMVLMLTRPEAWLFSLLVPFFYLVKKQLDGIKSIKDLASIPKTLIFHSTYKETYKNPVFMLFILVTFLAAYFIAHKILFGFALPNTFYIKSGSHFSPVMFSLIILSILPLLLLAVSKRLSLLFLFGSFFLVIGIQYSTSDLQMNYVDRFLFHIIIPVYFILVYIASKNDSINILISNDSNNFVFKINTVKYIRVFSFILLAFFAIKPILSSDLFYTFSYYSRSLESHAEFGKALNQLKRNNKIDSFSFGDAGMAAYHSQLNSLDNIGLGSSLLAQNGFSEDLLDLYNPKVIAFHAQPDAIRIDEYNQKAIKEWVDKKGYTYVCDIYTAPEYILKIYALEIYAEITSVCDSSKVKNNIEHIEYMKSELSTNPVSYWHE